MRLLRWWALALLAGPVLFGCERAAAPVLVEGAVRFEPPPAYELWWEMTQECSGRRGLLSRVDWYYVPGSSMLLVNGQRVEGYWTSAGNTIVLAESAMLSGSLVRHEMLHSLERGDGHSRAYFLERCGGVVWCSGACLEDAGPPPPVDPAAARVAPDALEIDVAIRPSSPSLGMYGGHFALIVTARNPRAGPVTVTLPTGTFGEPASAFEYRVETPVGGEGGRAPAWDETVTRFAPGETKRQVFDFHIFTPGGSGGIGSGTYRFFGAYGGRWAAASRAVAVP